MTNILFTIRNTLISVPGIVVGLSFHEFAHAWVATLCGDRTPEDQGRVTLNPLVHFDIIGLISLLLVGFGWGRPVVVDPRNFKKRRRDSIFVGLAGVVMNFCMALLFAFIIRLLCQFCPNLMYAGYDSSALYEVLFSVVTINISLMLFNLLPIPPLDGFGVICDIFNIRDLKFIFNARRYGMPILILMVAFDIPSRVLTAPFVAIVNLVFNIAFIGL